jgi:hypothetical protein
MAHFAELDNNNIVQRVIVVSNKNTSDGNGVESEDIGVAFCKTLYGSDTNWKQCSYSMKIRRAFPSTGMVYSSTHDAFHDPSPFPSWVLDSNAFWQPPNAEPSITDEDRELGYFYYWNETEYQKDSSTGWFLFTPQLITINTQPSPTTVSVSVGSSVNVSAAATVSKDQIEAVLERAVVDDNGNEIWFYTAGSVQSEDSSLSTTINTGILTDTSHSGKYRIAFAPLESGVIGYTSSVTITVTD